MKIFNPGIYDISNDEYHSSAGISRSGISELKKSPLHYWNRYLNTEHENNKPTSAMLIGSVVHTLVLEPEKFYDEYSVLKKVDLRKKEGKEYKKNLEESSNGKNIIKEDDYNTACVIADSVISHKRTGQILTGALFEKSIFWKDSDTGLLCKARTDIWNKDINVICDLKTTIDSTPDAFKFSVKKYDYHIQAAMQIDAIYNTTGQEINSFALIAVSNEKPHYPYIYTLSKRIIEQGREEYKDALKVIKICLENNKWYSEREKILAIEYSPYLFNQNPFRNLLEIYNHE